MKFTRAAKVVAGILFHSSIMTSQSCWMLYTWCFSTFRLRMPHMCSIGFRSGDILGHSITFTFSSKAVSSWLCVWGGYVGKQFLKGGHHLLLHNVTVHVGIHVSLNEPQLPSTSHPAPDHDATTTMLDCRQGTNFLILLTRASPHMLDTIWVKQVYLRLIRPQDMVPVIHALDQVVFSKLFAGFFVSQLQKRLPSGMTAMQTDLLQCVAYGLSTDKLTFHFCNCSEWNPSWKTSVWPWLLYCNSVPGCYRTSYSLGQGLATFLAWRAIFHLGFWPPCSKLQFLSLFLDKQCLY